MYPNEISNEIQSVHIHLFTGIIVIFELMVCLLSFLLMF